MVGEKGGGWAKGRKDRMKRERRPDQTQAVRAGIKREKLDTFRSSDEVQ